MCCLWEFNWGSFWNTKTERIVKLFPKDSLPANCWPSPFVKRSKRKSSWTWKWLPTSGENWSLSSLDFGCLKWGKQHIRRERERGKTVNVTLVSDDQRYDPPSVVPQEWQHLLPEGAALSSAQAMSLCSLCCHTDQELPACLGRAGYLAFPNRNSTA